MVSCKFCSLVKTEATDKQNITFHSLPKETFWRKIWLSFIGKYVEISDDIYLCSQHFDENCFDRRAIYNTKLKYDAIPTIHAPTDKQVCNTNNRIKKKKIILLPKKIPEKVKEEEKDVVEYNPYESCRVCTAESGLVHIFDTEALIDIPTELYNATSMKVTRDDKFPQKICLKCLGQLNDIVRFKKLYLETHEYFSKLLGIGEEKPVNTEEIPTFPKEDLSNEEPVHQTDHDYTRYQDDDFDDGGRGISDDELLTELKEFICDKSDIKTDNKTSTTEVVTTSDSASKSGDKEDSIKEEDIDEYDPKFLILPKRKRIANYKKKQALRQRRLFSNLEQSEKIEKFVDSMLEKEKEVLENNKTVDYKTKIFKRTNKPIKCEHCCLFLATHEDLVDHLRRIKHTREFRMKMGSICKHCNGFVAPGKMRQHLRKHYQKYDQECVCDICGKLVKQHNMNRHKLTHLEERPYKCHICPKSFTQKGSLEDHINLHTGNKPYMCDICGKTFAQLSSYCSHKKEAHIKKETGTSAPLKKPPSEGFKCVICDKVLASKFSYDSHRSLHGIKDFECFTCGKLFATQTKLNTHMARHSSDRKFKCQYCEKTFIDNFGLTTHMRIHEGIKPFVCQICNKAFTQNSHLYYHMRIHTGEKNYHCGLCGKSYRLKGSLIVHMRTHTGEMPYACFICHKKFIDSSSMTKHIKRIHEQGEENSKKKFKYEVE